MLSRQKIRLAVSALVVSGCLSNFNTDVRAQTGEGAALGGVAGAVIGGIVGHQNDETPEGALIGGAIGAVTGGVIGRARAQSQQRQQIYTQPVYGSAVAAQPGVPYYSTPARKPVSIADVITLTRSGVSEGVIINQIHTNGVINHPEVNEVVLMHQQGVSNVVIESMQQANIGAPTAPVAAVPVRAYAAPAPVIIEQSPVIVTRPVYSPPVYLNFSRGYYPHHHHHHHF
jgi:hypothetical protein